jgi:hypothetical protein
MKDSERDFTIGPAAHNYPVINGAAQDKKAARQLLLEEASPFQKPFTVESHGCWDNHLKAKLLGALG